MAAKNPKHPRLNHLAKLPDSVTISNIVQHDNCDEYIVTLNTPEHRSCPHCGSDDCVVKDSKHAQTVRHIAAGQRGCIVTFRKRRLFCKQCAATFFENPDWLHPSLRKREIYEYRLSA